MTDSCSYDCSVEHTTIEPYSDISGIGVSCLGQEPVFESLTITLQVLIGFVGTAYICVIVMVGYYLFAFQPELDPFRKHDGSVHLTGNPNPPDRLFLIKITINFRKNTEEQHDKQHKLEPVA
jgi:hypothetical protein